MKIKRGEIYLADLNPAIGSEQGGVRPVLVIQNNKGNKHSPTIIVASISAKINTKHILPTHYYLNPETTGLKTKSIVMFEQIRVIDKSRLHSRIGYVSSKLMNVLDKRIMISLGIQNMLQERK